MTAANTQAVMLAAGGTGGHMFPARATADALRARGITVILSTDARGARYTDGFPADEVITLPAAQLPLRKPWAWPVAMMRIRAGIKAAHKAIKHYDVGCVAGFGGYPTVPGLLAAKTANIATIIHDQNAVPGRVNRLFAGRVDAVFSGFPVAGTGAFARRATVVGNPVRAAIANLADYQPPVPDGPLNLLILGGSQGARILGAQLPQALCALPAPLRDRLRVVQQARAEQADTVTQTYDKARISAEVAPFFSDIPDRLATAHLVISRPGASSVSELAASGHPSLLIPFAAAMDDHQTGNAQTLVRAGAAVMLSEAEATPEHIVQTLQPLLQTPDRLLAMAQAARRQAQPNAAKRLADEIESRLKLRV